ncbi:MAG TPA: nucleotidyltransferase domain-containing protein [Candidatus Nanoarchaeia archaeon]|nr:nucleotidyltransferase domain-containing protein [Candidatus Nanoarchaeia archaeon]
MIDTILGNKVLVRILRFLYLSPNRYFSFLELEQYLGAGREGIRQALRKLVHYDMAYVEEKGGKRYKINLDNPIIERLQGIFDYEKKFFQGIDPKKLQVLANVEIDFLKAVDGLQRIILFGSVAKGKAKERSDIDLLIVMKSGKNTVQVKTAIEEIKEKYEKRYAIQTILMDELELTKRKKELFVQEVLKTGIDITLRPV